MSYSLGVDLGTTFVAAAVSRPAESRPAGPSGAAQVEMFTLGDRSVVTPAVVYVREDGQLITGDAANRRAVSHPDRIAKEFKRRLGDPTPVILGGSPYPVTALLAALLRDVTERVSATEGGPPQATVLTHPANWGPFRRELFEEVPQLAGIPAPHMVTEPEAAAAHYAAVSRLADGDVVAVYDLGGGTFDATVLRKLPQGMEILGSPEGIERLGGVDFDEAVLSYVNYAAGGALTELDLGDAATTVALARLRQDCILAKEALSVDTETTIPVFLPNRHFDVTLTRQDFENMIRAPLESTLGALTRTLRSANVSPSELAAVLLVGGSSRIPLVASMIAEEIGRPTVVDAHPKHAVALGAATLAEASEAVTGPHGAPAPSVGVPTPAPPPVQPQTAGRMLAGAGATSGNGFGSGELAPAHAKGSTALASAPARATETSAGGAGSASRGSGAYSPPGGATVPPPGMFGPGTDSDPGVTVRVPSGAPPPPVRPGGAPPGRDDRGPRRALLVGLLVAALLLVAGGVGWYLLAGSGSGSGSDTSAAPQAGPPPRPQGPAVAVPVPTIGMSIPAGQTPGFVAISPNGRQAYVANRTAGVITVIDTAVNRVTATIPVKEGPPQYLAFAPDGKRVYVSIFNDEKTINTVGVLDTTSNSIVTTISVGTRPFALKVSPDGKRLYVPNHDSGTVSVIDTAKNSVIADIKVAPNPHWVAISRDGTRIYTANHESGVVSIIDAATNTVVGEVKVGISPHSLSVSPNKPIVANVNYDSASVTAIDTNTEKVVATVPVGRNPQAIEWSADGRFVYVCNVSDNTISVISTDTWTATATIPTPDAPTSIAVLPDGTEGFVTNLNTGTVSVLNLTG